jgi:spore coat protein U-like protein
MAQDVATTTASAQATVVAPLTLIKVTDLNFGRVAARPTAGTVTVNPNTGACTVTGGLIHQGACQYAEFAGMGTKKMTVRIQVPTSITLTGPGGATMLVNNIALGTAPELQFIGGNGNGLGNGNRRYEIVSNTGIFTFRVAGRLNVGANQAPGTYTGTFQVVAQYQ